MVLAVLGFRIGVGRGGSLLVICQSDLGRYVKGNEIVKRVVEAMQIKLDSSVKYLMSGLKTRELFLYCRIA